jgi:protein-S-isoprenylcysteine O-methyltransferase Ste14
VFAAGEPHSVGQHIYFENDVVKAQGNQQMNVNNHMQTRKVIRAIIGFTLFLFFVPALLFISAGTANWPMAWVYVTLFLASTIGSRLIVLKRNPDTLRERARFAASEGTKSWDRILFAINGLFGSMAIIVVGLDHRFDWSTIIPEIGQYLAALVIAVGYGLGVWAMVVNRYFSAVARIQQDRGQVVMTTGPYRIIRHPAYAGAWFGIAGRVAWWQGWAFLFTFISFREYLGVASIKVEPRTGARAQSSS